MIELIERTVAAVGMWGRRPIGWFFRLAGANERYAVSKYEDLVSFIELKGCMKHLGPSERDGLVESFELALGPMLKDQGHIIEILWKGDPDASHLVVDKYVNELKEGAEKSGMTMPEAFDGQLRVLKERVLYEECIVAVWTLAKSLNAIDKARDQAARAKTYGDALVTQGHRPLQGLRSLEVRHEAATQSLVDSFRRADIAASALSTKEGLQKVRETIYPNLLGSKWEPQLGVAGMGPRSEERLDKQDFSTFFPPTLEEQMIVQGAEDITSHIVRVGDCLFSYVNMIDGATKNEEFGRLVREVNKGRSIPWRVVFRLEGGARVKNWHRMAAAAFEKTNAVNRIILDSIERRDEWARAGKVGVNLSVSFCTWAPATERGELESRTSQLIRMVESWSGMKVAADTRDPLAGALASVPGINPNTIAQTANPPLESALKLLPIMRPGSPWKSGCKMFHTADGRPFIYDTGSPEQTAWFDIIIGEQGKGKSSLTNSLNLAYLQYGGRSLASGELQNLGIIDVGSSSRGLVEAVRDALPRSRQHQAVHVRWQNDKRFAFNCFDTPLGIRIPLAVHRDFLNTFMAAVFGAAGSQGSELLMDAIIAIVDEAYRVCSEEATQRRYEENKDEFVDNALELKGIKLPPRASWWDVVDRLFTENLTYEALRAQRYAVPTLPYLAEIVSSSDRIKHQFAQSNIGGEKVLDVIRRKITAAQREFPILCSETRFELREARVIALDLSEVVMGQGEQANKRTEVMYLAARQLIGGEYYLGEDDFGDLKEPYQSYHLNRIRQAAKRQKRLCYDEFHRTAGAPNIGAQVQADVLVGRKYGVQIALISQLISHFSNDLLATAQSFFICSAGGDVGLNALKERLSMSGAALEAIRTQLTGPSRRGSPFFGIFSTVEGRFEHLLTNSMSAEELWALTTHKKDSELKRLLERRLGRETAWRVLCKRFPGGSAQERVKILTDEIADRNGREDPVDLVVEELCGGANAV